MKFSWNVCCYTFVYASCIFFSFLLPPYSLPHWSTGLIAQFLDISQVVGLLGRVISSSQGLYLNTGQHKHRKTWTHIKHPCPGWDLNPRSRPLNNRRPSMLQITRLLRLALHVYSNAEFSEFTRNVICECKVKKSVNLIKFSLKSYIISLINSQTPDHCKYIRLQFTWYTESKFQRTGRFTTEENSQIPHLHCLSCNCCQVNETKV
jgi:hypothetical protein